MAKPQKRGALSQGTDISTVYQYCIAGIVYFICFIGSPAGQGLHYTDAYREAMLTLGGVILFALWLNRNRHSTEWVLQMSALRAFLLGLFLFAALSIFWASNITFFLSKYLLWLGMAGLIFAMLNIPANVKTLVFFARILVVCGVYISLVGLIQALFKIDIFAQGAPPSANFLNKNSAAQCVLLMVPFGVFLSFVDKQKTWAFFYPFCLTIMLAYIFHTHTRSAWLSTLLQFLVLVALLIVCRKSIREGFAQGVLALPNKIAVGAATLLLVLLVNISATGWTPITNELKKEALNVYTRATTQGGSGRGSNRFHIWGSAISMVKASPVVGTGMGSFYNNVSLNAGMYKAHGELRVHNDLLELGVELGVIGWLLFLGALISLFAALYALIRQGDIRYRFFFLLLVVGLSGTALNMQFSFPYQMPTPLMLLGLYLGFIIKHADPYVAVRKFVIPVKSWNWNLALTCSGMVFLGSFVMHFLWVSTFEQANILMKKQRWQNTFSSPLMCHKTIVKSLHDLAVTHTRQGRYRMSNKILLSFGYCLPDIWLIGNIKGVNLIGLQRYHEAIEVLEVAKDRAPVAAYLDYINLFLAYYQTRDLENAKRIYEEFRTEPEEDLAVQRISYRKLTQAALYLGEIEQGLELYALHSKYHEKHPELEAAIKPYLLKKQNHPD